jgi:hypothetical protein
MIESAGNSHSNMILAIMSVWDFWVAIVFFPFIIVPLEVAAVGSFALAVPQAVSTGGDHGSL